MQQQLDKKTTLKYQIMGWVYLGMFFAAIVSAVYYFQVAATPINTDPVIHRENPILLQIDSEGGYCVGGPCVGAVVLKSDGSYIQVYNGKIEAQAKLETGELASLRALIEVTDFDAIRAKKFTGTCAPADDGLANTFTFYTSKGTQKIYDCDFQIDYKKGLFADLAKYFNLSKY